MPLREEHSRIRCQPGARSTVKQGRVQSNEHDIGYMHSASMGNRAVSRT